MTATMIRQKLHSYLEVAVEKKIKAIYTMMEEDIEDTLVEYTDELKKELNQRFVDYQCGKVKMITARNSKASVIKLLGKKNKK